MTNTWWSHLYVESKKSGTQCDSKPNSVCQGLRVGGNGGDVDQRMQAFSYKVNTFSWSDVMYGDYS